MNLLKSSGAPGCLAAKEQMIVNHSLFPFYEYFDALNCGKKKGPPFFFQFIYSGTVISLFIVTQ